MVDLGETLDCYDLILAKTTIPFNQYLFYAI